MSRCLMWKKEDSKPEAVPGNSALPAISASSSSAANASTLPVPGALPISSRASACISQGIKIKGEVTGSEDLFVDGVVEGKLEGKVTGRDKVQLWSTGQITGEVQTDRLAIEDGALLRGKVEAGRQANKPAEIKAAAATATGQAADTASLNSGTVAN